MHLMMARFGGPFFLRARPAGRRHRHLIVTLAVNGAALGSVQNLSHFRSCDGGSMGLKFHFV
jgi:hypothetical protein